MTKVFVKAEALTVGARLDSARKARVAAVHVRGGNVLVKVTVRGTRSGTLKVYPLGTDVATY